MHHNPSFNLLILNNSLIHLIVKEAKINKSGIFFTFLHTAFYENFLPTTHSINLHLPVIALVLFRLCSQLT